MRRYLDLSTWIFLFALLPVTVLILLSQNTIPGDLFYPVKRGMENMILVAASVSPTTKVAFRTDLTQRRFSEAQQLLVSKADTSAYNDFVNELVFAKEDLTKVSSAKDKIESSEKLIAKIEEYQVQLAQTENQVQIAQALPTTPIQVPASPSQTEQPVPSQAPASQAPIPTPTATSQPVPAEGPASTRFGEAGEARPDGRQTITPSFTPAPSAEGPTPTPAVFTPTVTNTIANNPIKAEEVKEKIKDTKEHLERIKEDLKKEKEDAEFKEKVKEEIQKERKSGEAGSRFAGEGKNGKSESSNNE